MELNRLLLIAFWPIIFAFFVASWLEERGFLDNLWCLERYHYLRYSEGRPNSVR